eukprot:g39995.t1
MRFPFDIKYPDDDDETTPATYETEMESGNVFHVKHETKKYQYAKVTGTGSTVYETVNAASEHLQVDRALIRIFGGDNVGN